MAQQEMLTANLICMQVQGEWKWLGRVVVGMEVGGGGVLIPFPISMLNAGQGS